LKSTGAKAQSFVGFYGPTKQAEEKSRQEGHGCSRAAMGCVDEGFICVLNCFEAAGDSRVCSYLQRKSVPQRLKPSFEGFLRHG
jgi:hypothetical protein